MNGIISLKPYNGSNFELVSNDNLTLALKVNKDSYLLVTPCFLAVYLGENNIRNIIQTKYLTQKENDFLNEALAFCKSFV